MPTKSTKNTHGGYRAGARRPKLNPADRLEKYIVSLPAGLIEAFEIVIGGRLQAKNQIRQWVRGYTVARGESDRLFAQSPTLLRVIAYLEAQSEPPEDLLDECHSLLVERTPDGELPSVLIV